MPQQGCIHIRSDEVNEVLTTPPNSLLRWGTSVIFILILVFIALSYFIQYPDVLKAEIIITTQNPPIKLTAKTEGKLKQLFVSNAQVLNSGAVIAVIENTADFKDVLSLDSISKRMLDQLNASDVPLTEELPAVLNTGELTPYFLQSLKALKEYHLYQSINPNQQQITILKKEQAAYGRLANKYKTQQSISAEALALTEKDFKRDKELFTQGCISAREFDAKKKEYLNALQNQEQQKITQTNALIQLTSIEKNILQLQLQDYQEMTRLKNELQVNLKTLQTQIKDWRQKFLLETPVAGKISFFSVWKENQNVKTGDELFSVIPEQTPTYIGKCRVPLPNSGKLKIGQQVNIKVNNYNSAEEGVLIGKITCISEVPTKDAFLVDVMLQNGLTTSYNKPLDYKHEMKGEAEIVTQIYSVMDRLFLNFRNLTKR